MRLELNSGDIMEIEMGAETGVMYITSHGKRIGRTASCVTTLDRDEMEQLMAALSIQMLEMDRGDQFLEDDELEAPGVVPGVTPIERIVVTGALSVTRAEATRFLDETHDIEVGSTITKKGTDRLVVGGTPGSTSPTRMTSKHRQARSYGIPIITEEELMAELGYKVYTSIKEAAGL